MTGEAMTAVQPDGASGTATRGRGTGMLHMPQLTKRIAATIATAAVWTLLALSVASRAASASTLSTTDITIDGTKAGPAFQGVGAISGGGGNSRLLIDYPEPQRSQILDYLFKPNYGATIQLLKLEIGGDANSTDGAEASVEHAQGQIDCDAGYEWWVAQQAKARNANVKLYGLQWAAPGWVGSNGTLWTQSDVDYVIDWLNCARSHGLTVDYLGGWNEKGYNIQWYETMRAALDTNGYGSVKIVAADEDPNTSSGYDPAAAWAVANDMADDPTFDSSIAVLGAPMTPASTPPRATTARRRRQRAASASRCGRARSVPWMATAVLPPWRAPSTTATTRQASPATCTGRSSTPSRLACHTRTKGSSTPTSHGPGTTRSTR